MEFIERLIAKLEARLLAILDFHPHLERQLMSLAQALKDAAGANSAAISGLTAKVDALVTLSNSNAAALAALVSANGDSIPAADVQSVIDSLNAGVAAANAEGDKVAAAITADTPPATGGGTDAGTGGDAAGTDAGTGTGSASGTDGAATGG